jgi:hypothetical protein
MMGKIILISKTALKHLNSQQSGRKKVWLILQYYVATSKTVVFLKLTFTELQSMKVSIKNLIVSLISIDKEEGFLLSIFLRKNQEI